MLRALLYTFTSQRAVATSVLTPPKLQRLQDARPSRASSGAANASSSITTTSLVGDLRGQRHPRGHPQRLPRQAVADNRAAAWRTCDRRHGGYRSAASRPGRCPSPSGDTSSSSCRPLRRASSSCAEPCRRFAWYITTTSCSNCLLMRGASSAGSISYFPTSAPVRSNTGNVAIIHRPIKKQLAARCRERADPNPPCSFPESSRSRRSGPAPRRGPAADCSPRRRCTTLRLRDGHARVAVLARHPAALERRGCGKALQPVDPGGGAPSSRRAWPAGRGSCAASSRRQCRGPCWCRRRRRP